MAPSAVLEAFRPGVGHARKRRATPVIGPRPPAGVADAQEVTLLTLALDGRAATHLYQALRAHRRWAATNGYSMPDALAALEQTLIGTLGAPQNDRSRQKRVEKGGLAVSAASVKPMTMTVTEVAGALGISTRSVQRLVRSGEVRSAKIGRSRRIPLAELERLTGTTNKET